MSAATSHGKERAAARPACPTCDGAGHLPHDGPYRECPEAGCVSGVLYELVCSQCGACVLTEDTACVADELASDGERITWLCAACR